MVERDTFSWNTIIRGYVQASDMEQADSTEESGVMEYHNCRICGAIIDARAIFDEMGLHKDVITWNAMIGGCASHGNGSTALKLFEAMKRKRVQPTYITFISILNACSHAGLLDEGRTYFASMISDFGIEPRTEHYAALVDIAGRHGQLKEALDFISSMPHKPDKAMWGALLAACKIHKNIELARIAADALAELEPESSASYVLLHNTLPDLDHWEDAKEVRKSMEGNAIKKEHASSWFENCFCAIVWSFEGLIIPSREDQLGLSSIRE
ncbi:hypothetical protein Cgig2_023932 [Carnegiea gigantea]|uniref:Pentatricopeptide repeat-containing protein n=1 Tax=Carnegiea gigantea TaxID=171969 RepID=A0A9Q1K1W8_9CARY|nr:hypothetical protein Cgig2_023932 [Carnegiea gigantea]